MITKPPLVCAAADYAAAPHRFELWRRHRPLSTRPVRGSAARLWWRRTAACVSEQVRRQAPAFSWDTLRRRREERKRYVALYAQRLRYGRDGRKASEVERAALTELERALPIESILFYRHRGWVAGVARARGAAAPALLSGRLRRFRPSRAQLTGCHRGLRLQHNG